MMLPVAPRFFVPVLLAAALLMSVCCSDVGEYRPNAVGREGEIQVIIDSSRWNGSVGEALRAELGATVETLPGRPQPLFDLSQGSLSSAFIRDKVRSQKNIIFVAPLSDSTAEARFLRDRLDESARSAIESGERTAVVQRPDLWRRNQMVVYITASDGEALTETIEESGEDLRYVFNDITRRRTQTEMFERQRQLDLEDTLMTRHGFAVNVQHDYFIAADTTVGEGTFVWLRRIPTNDSWRSLFIYYEEGANPSRLDPEWIYGTRDSLAKRYISGTVGGWPEIDMRRPLVTENVNFLGRYGFETRGIWDMVEYTDEGDRIQYGDAGPLLNYTFYDQDQGRIYMIDGMVFAPKYEKREFLRQLEVIANTFRTRDEAESADEAVAAEENGASG